MPKTNLLTPAAPPHKMLEPESAPRKKQPKLIELPPDLYSNRLIDAATVAQTLGYSLAHFRRLYRAGKITAPVKINGRKVGWPASALQSLLTSKQRVA